MEIISRKISEKLAIILEEIDQRLDNYQAISFPLEKLAKDHQSLYQTKIAVNIVNGILSDYSGWIFHYPNNNIAVLFECEHSDQIADTVIARIRHLFSNDSLAFFSNRVANPSFAEKYNLPIKYEKLKNFLTAPLQDQNISKISSDNNPFKKLSELENSLASFDLNPLIKKQPIAAFFNGKFVKNLFHEVFLSTPRLTQLLKGNLLANQTPLFSQYSSEIINNAVLLQIIKNPSLVDAAPFSINISVDGIMSDTFTKFDEYVQTQKNVTTILEINIANAFLDLHKFYHAIYYVQEKGYKVCLDGLDELSLTLISRENFHADFGKFQIKETTFKQMDHDIVKTLDKSTEKFGKSKLIMTGCDTPELIELGEQLDLHLFQGNACDQSIKNKVML